MSEVKFSCAYCGQPIACDDAYCSNAISCPSCGHPIFVPRLSTFIEKKPGQPGLVMPVAEKTHFVPSVAKQDFWTQAEWDKHYAEVTGERPEMHPVVWCFLAAPMLCSFVMATRGAGLSAMAACFVISALLAGFAWSWSRNFRGTRLALMGVVVGFAVLAGYGCLALALVAGCALL